VLVAGLVSVSAPGALAGSNSSGRRPRCDGRRATVVGTPGDDVITAAGVVFAGPGDDRVIASADGTVVCGGPGDDTISGEGTLKGGLGRDHVWGDGTLLGGPGDDRIGVFGRAARNETSSSYGELRGGRGDDRIRGSHQLNGGRGDDHLVGSSSDDRFEPGPGDDNIRGVANDWDPSEQPGPGHDALDLRGSPRAVRVDVEAGIAIGWGRDSFSGLHRIRGSRFDDRIFGLRTRTVLPDARGDS
jgi:hypothetical protein